MLVLPARIEAEEYEAFSDTTPGNTTMAYRQDDVDLESCSDTDCGYNISYTENGEWTEYSVNIPEDDTYTLAVRVASNNGGAAIAVSADGDTLTTFNISATGDWQSYKTLTKQVQLKAGITVLRFETTERGHNFNWFEIRNYVPSIVKEVKNPIIPGFNPDPSIVRVGEDYYLTTSTFEYFPGLPIYHSKNLINWELIGHAIHRRDQMTFTKVKSTSGLFAPTIRYHNGTFYVINTMVMTYEYEQAGGRRGNFIVTAKSPEGPWSDPIWIENDAGIDPSLFFDDDGKAYYTGNMHPENKVDSHHRVIWTQELDLKTFKLVGKRSILESKEYFPGGSKAGEIGSAAAFEGPHLFKKNGIYYMTVAHGGTGTSHAVSIWRSDSPHGPWRENSDNPILTHRGYDNPIEISATGHADFVQTQNGDWYTVFLGIRANNSKESPMGRETFMLPVDWSGMWPIVNPDGPVGRAVFTFNAPNLPGIVPVDHNFRDDFSGPLLDKQWSTPRSPPTTWWDYNKRNGWISLDLREDDFEEYSEVTFLGKRVFQNKIEMTTKMDFEPSANGERAGLVLLRGNEPNWKIVKELRNGVTSVSAYKNNTLLKSARLEKSGHLELRIKLDGFQLSFFYKEEGGSYTKLADSDGSDLGFPTSGRYTGSMSGPYASSQGGRENNVAHFDWFTMLATDK